MKILLILTILCALVTFASCSFLKINSTIEIAMNEAGYMTSSYLFKSQDKPTLAITSAKFKTLLKDLTKENLEARIETTLTSLNKIVSEKKDLDPKISRYINKGIKFLNLATDINETSIDEAMTGFKAFITGSIEGIDILLGV